MFIWKMMRDALYEPPRIARTYWLQAYFCSSCVGGEYFTVYSISQEVLVCYATQINSSSMANLERDWDS